MNGIALLRDFLAILCAMPIPGVKKSNQSEAIELGSRDNSSGGLGATGLSGA
jgi:hypothetical protein